MAKKISPFEDSLIHIDFASQVDEFINGKPVGETARIPVLSQNFSWKKSFMNCWTGWPNDGKSTYFQFKTLMKSVCDDWKWCIWPPEMLNSAKNESGKMVVSASDIVDELVFMYTGKNPYKHFEQKYGVKQMKRDEYMNALEWVQEHYIFINPKEKSYKNLMDNFRYIHEHFGPDGYLVDPFKNIDHGENGNGRFDLYLDRTFAETKEFCIDTNTSFNFIAHPRNDKDPKNPDGSYRVCNQFMLAGGASWNNNMDGIFSIYRPFKHQDPTDPRVTFFTLKQRKQQLVGRVGAYDKIEFDFMTNRYYFDGYCPIDSTYKEPIALREKRQLQEESKKATFVRNQGKKQKPKPEEPKIEFTETKMDFSQDINDNETLF